MRTLLLLACLGATSALAAADPASDLEAIEAAIKADPDNPVLHYRKCQALFSGGKQQGAVDHAAIALEKFKAAGKDLAWMKLGSIKTDKHTFDVHYNMGPKERAEKKDGIVRPYSFRVWTAGAEPGKRFTRPKRDLLPTVWAPKPTLVDRFAKMHNGTA